MRPVALWNRTAAAALVLVGACRAPAPCSDPAALTCEVSCPRDSAVDASGRCSCRSGDLPLLGACVPPAVADAYCGRAGRASPEGCSFLRCGADEAVDSENGCVPIASLVHGASGCPAGAALVVASSRAACVVPDVACPRGSQAQGASCVRAPRCPAGSLASAGRCRPILVPRYAGMPVVDLGAWASIVLGIDGGPGSSDLCRPLEGAPATFGVERGQSLVVELRVAITVPDEDISRVRADVDVNAEVYAGPPKAEPAKPEPTKADADTARPLPPAAGPAAAASVGSLLEALRGLGGQSIATRTEVAVQCTISNL